MSTLRVDQITDEEGTGAPDFPNGIEVAGGALAGLADQAEAEAGTDNTKLMTPLRTAQAIAELSPAPSELTQTQVEDSSSTVFGTVSGQRLEQQTNAAFNVTGAAPKFACRAWVNFNGFVSPGPAIIRASGNVSSVVANTTGDYTVNFATAMPDANFCAVAVAGAAAADTRRNTQCPFGQAPTITSVRLETHGDASRFNLPFISVSIFR